MSCPCRKTGGRPAYKGICTRSRRGTPLIQPPGTVRHSVCGATWRTFWESRADLFLPGDRTGILSSLHSQVSFLADASLEPAVLGQFHPHWQLVVAQQKTTRHSSPSPMSSIPHSRSSPSSTRRIPTNGSKVAFQAIIGISNVDGNQKKVAALELGSERSKASSWRPLRQASIERLLNGEAKSTNGSPAAELESTLDAMTGSSSAIR